MNVPRQLNRSTKLIDTGDGVRIVAYDSPRGLSVWVLLISYFLWFLYLSVKYVVPLGYATRHVWVALAFRWSFFPFVVWGCFGVKEELIANSAKLSIRFHPWGRWHHYLRREMKRLTLAELGKDSKGIRGIASLSLEYDHKYVLFGRGLDTETAQQVLASLREKLQLSKEPNTPPLHSSNTPTPKDSITPEVNHDQS